MRLNNKNTGVLFAALFLAFILFFFDTAFAGDKVVIGGDDGGGLKSEESKPDAKKSLEESDSTKDESPSPEKKERVVIGGPDDEKDKNLPAEPVKNEVKEEDSGKETEKKVLPAAAAVEQKSKDKEEDEGGAEEKEKEKDKAKEKDEEKNEENDKNQDKTLTDKESENTAAKKASKKAARPQPPSAITAAFSGGGVKLGWNEIEGIHHYNIYRENSNKIPENPANYYTNKNEYEDLEVISGKTYYYFLTSAFKDPENKGKYIESTFSDPIEVTTEDKRPPEAVVSLKAVSAENGKISLVWQKPFGGAPVDKYVVLRCETDDAASLKEIKTSFTESFEDTGLEDEKKYFYSVAAVSAAGIKSALSPLISVTPKDTLAPEAPVNIVAAPHNNRVELGWEKPKNNDIAYYTIYKSENGQTDFIKISTPALITEEKFTDNSVRGGREYYYKLSASDKNANESKMSAQSVGVKIKVPLNISFAKTGEKSYYGFSFNPESRSLYLTESADGKTWSWWTLVIQNFPLPDNFSGDCRIAFAKDGKKIIAFIYDTGKMSINSAVSVDEGKNWKWWEIYSSSLPLPDGFDENTKINFSVKGNQVHCICFNAAAKALSAASTTDGKSWKWWKKYGENLSSLPNQTDNSHTSACFYGGGFEAYSYNLDDKTLYKGTLPAGGSNYSSWNEISSKFPAPPQ
jgi:fibronectin type 3 domain-containing protein